MTTTTTTTLPQYRIFDTQKVTVNGKRSILFRAAERQADGSYHHVGQFLAPASTRLRDLPTFIAFAD